MNPDKLSAVVSLLVAIAILVAAFFQWEEVLPFEGKIKVKRWAKLLFLGCIVFLALALLLLFW